MKTIYIIRHGQTENNKARVLQGRSDLPLNEEGSHQAEEARAFFENEGIVFDRIYSSPLIRAIQTAQIVSGENEDNIITDDHLLEMDYGPYEGCSLLEPPPEIIEFFSDFVNNPAPEGMEDLTSVVARMGEFMETLADDGEEEQIILISTHAIAMKGALEYLTPDANGYYWSKHIANCEVYKTILSDGAFTVPTEAFPV